MLVLNEANRDLSPIEPGVPRLYGIAKPEGAYKQMWCDTDKMLYWYIFIYS